MKIEDSEFEIFIVSIAGKIIEDSTGSMDSRFTMNNPVFLPYGFRQVNLFELSANTGKEDTSKQLR